MDDRTKLITTALGDVEISVNGTDIPVLVIHGSPSGIDGAIAMSRFLPNDKFQTVCPSRPGYLRTPLDKVDTSIDYEADLLAALLDTLGLDRVGLLAWSGGGPSAYRLAVRHPQRISSIVAIAAVSSRWVAPKPSLSQRIMFGTAFGEHAIAFLSRHLPDHVVKGALEGEGSLRGAELDQLAAYVSDNPSQRQLVLDTARTVNVAGSRKAGWENDVRNFSAIGSLQLEKIRCPTLLVHGDVDTDAVLEYSHEARAAIADSELLVMKQGTHLAFYAHPQAEEVQEQARGWFAKHR